MTDEELLAEMRKHYQYATLEDYILVDGVLYGRCGICRKRPIPHTAIHVMWCDECMNECEESNEGLEAFVARKRAETNA